ncbi:MAG: hypothetical protein U7M05_08445 [Candidatus Igneacidithiobacillus chanchocoensis]
MTKMAFSTAILAAVCLISANLATAEPVDLQINVGTTPVIVGYPAPVLAAPPLMVWLPELGVYAAYGSQQPIFYTGSSYYYFYSNRWWAGPAYRGPWHPIPAPPPGLRRWSPRGWPQLQRQAEYHARNPHWRQFRPQQRPLPPPPPQYRPHGPEHGRPPQPGPQWRPGPQGPHGEHGRPEGPRPGRGPDGHRPDHGRDWQNQ